ncbi:MFS transporter [Streptomyces sp. H10-C2]|uniref:MFS transporter n=1 Tax=unclassified Streptomyces TaxID=2593676 RepID=UPI0024B93614|nr:MULTISPECIES: MFS transporter [unclassified Streptomyces]MDJ0347263.1 MFS transporter [Streptomyces sp. PH10-H1]MDJ0375495.1 MFS transporter [Streptomyces sp. H10-C2]
MSLPPNFPVTDPFVRRTWRLTPGVAFYLQASIVVAFLAASSAPTPLYAVYQGEWGFSPITTTMVFGIYALAVLAALLTVGSLSDHIGRRPVLLAAIALQAVAMIVLTTAGGVSELMIARIIQGLSTGAAVGAVGAGMLDLDKAKGTIANAVAPMTGTATGALASGLLVQLLPAPTHLVYVALLGVFVLQGAGVVLMRETSAPKPGALASLRPRFGVPKAARGPLLVAAPVLIAVWALAGLYGSVIPAVVRSVVGSDSLLLGGLALFTLAGSGAVTVLLLRNAAPGRVMLLGTVALIVGVGVTLLAVDHNVTALFFIGTVIAGVGFGGGFQGAIRTIVPLAAPHERSGLLSTIYVLSYLAMGLPAVIGGFLVVYGGGLLATTREYGIAVMALGALALLGLAVPRRGTRGARESTVVTSSVHTVQAGAAQDRGVQDRSLQDVEFAKR